MSAPINTYRIRIDLPLGNVPQVDELTTDPDLYKELVDIHDSIMAIASNEEGINVELDDFIIKFRSNTSIDFNDSVYVVLPTDGTILVDASGGNVDIELPPAISYPGWRWDIKRVDSAPTINRVEIKGDGGDLIDGHPDGVILSPLSSYTVKSSGTGYNII